MRVVVGLLLLALLAPVVAAHGGGTAARGDTLANATPLGVPSFAFDVAPSGTSVHYYRFDARGDVHLRLAAPAGQEPAMLPVVFVFGPELGDVSAPSDVERPPGGGLSFPAGAREDLRIGALAAHWTVLLERDLALAPGIHVVAVRTQSASPLVLTLEHTGSPGIMERFVVPPVRAEAREWRGDSLWPSHIAATLGVLAVAAHFWVYRRQTKSFLGLTGHGAAAFFAASGMSLLVDAFSTRVGLLHGLASLSFALVAVTLARKSPRHPRWTHRALMVAVALAGFWLYAGYLWGPLGALAGAILPEPSAKDEA